MLCGSANENLQSQLRACQRKTASKSEALLESVAASSVWSAWAQLKQGRPSGAVCLRVKKSPATPQALDLCTVAGPKPSETVKTQTSKLPVRGSRLRRHRRNFQCVAPGDAANCFSRKASATHKRSQLFQSTLRLQLRPAESAVVSAARLLQKKLHKRPKTNRPQACRQTDRLRNFPLQKIYQREDAQVSPIISESPV